MAVQGSQEAYRLVHSVAAEGSVWLFIVFPLIGGALGAVIYRALFGRYNRLND